MRHPKPGPSLTQDRRARLLCDRLLHGNELLLADGLHPVCGRDSGDGVAAVREQLKAARNVRQRRTQLALQQPQRVESTLDIGRRLKMEETYVVKI